MPSFAPAGILTLTCLFLRTLPLPPQTEQGFSMILPSPPHLEHGVESAKNPWSRLCTPLPPHSGHVCGDVPGAAPVPLHWPHASSTGTATRVVTPFRASLKLNLMFTVMFSPFALVLWVVVADRPKISPRFRSPPRLAVSVRRPGSRRTCGGPRRIPAFFRGSRGLRRHAVSL